MINTFWQYIESIKKSEKKMIVILSVAKEPSYNKLQKAVGSKPTDKNF